MQADLLDITNPGMLPLGMTLEDLKNGVSNIRNKTISRIFSELGWVEQWGSGYKRIVEACERERYPVPKWEEFGCAVRVTFYPHSATKRLSAKLALTWRQVETKLELTSLTKRQAEIVKIIQQAGEISFREIVDQMKKPPADRTLWDELSRLKQLQLIDSKGFGRGALWYPLAKTDNKAE